MCTFWPCRHSGTWTFCLCWRFGTRTLQHGDFSAQGFFGTMDILTHGHLHTLAQVPKYPCPEMFRCRNILCQNVHGVENSLCQNVLVPKSPRVETSMETKCPFAGTSTGPKHACAKMSRWWNVHAEMSLREMSGAEMVGSLFWYYNIHFWIRFGYLLCPCTINCPVRKKTLSVLLVKINFQLQTLLFTLLPANRSSRAAAWFWLESIEQR